MARTPPNLPAVSRIVLHYTDSGSGASAINVLHVLSSGATNLDTFNRFNTAWAADLMAHTSTTVRLHTVDVTKLDNLTATEIFSTTGAKYDGTGSGEPNPAVALLVKLTTGFRGLGGSGRIFPPFVTESVAESGHIISSALPVLSAAWVAFVNTLTTQTIPLQVTSYGRFAEDDTQLAPATTHTVTAASLSPILATQRRRQSRLRG